MYLISIDSGKASTKWATYDAKSGKPIKGVFPTTYKPIKGDRFGKYPILVRYNSQMYSVGNPADLSVPKETSKLKVEHEICIYTAVAKALKAQGANLNQTQSVHLCLNVPLCDYKNSVERKKYRDKYYQEENPHTISLELDGEMVNFVISGLTLSYEGQGSMIYAAIEHEEMNLEEGDVLLTDIGGHNETILLFSDFAPVPDYNDALLNGVLKMFDRVSRRLTQHYDSPYTIHHVELLSKGEHRHQNEIKDFDEIYEECARELAERIKNSATNNVEIVNLTTFVFAGGGAQALKPFIEEAFHGLKYVILENSQYANCLGMLEKGLSEIEGE